MGTLSKTGPSTSKAYRQQWLYEGYLLREMINPLLGYDDPYYDNHDPDADVNEEWFQGRDGWDQTGPTLIKLKNKK